MQGRARSHISTTLPVVSSIVLSFLAALAPATAQITPDATLRRESSVVTPNVNVNGRVSDRIDGGAIRGANLFHSFGNFNIDAGRGAYFTNPAGIENILSRVTGTNPSNILGTLGVLGNANLFLINPNGIIFGINARLDVAGSFLASTANSMVFGNGFEFSTTNPQTPPLLTINRPLGLNYQTQQPGSLINAGNLAVPGGQNLTLVGGSVLTTGQLSAPGGQLSVVAVPSASLVQLGQAGQVLSLSSTSNPSVTTPVSSTLPALLNSVNYETGVRVTNNNQVELKQSGTRVPVDVGTVIVSGTLDASTPAVGKTGGTIQVLGNHVGLFDKARINASGTAGGGTVLIGGNYRGQGIIPQATASYVGRDVSINADALTTGNGGQIVVWANDSTRTYGSLSARGGAVAGNGGLVETSSRNFLSTSGIKVNTTAANGVSGTWLIDPRNIIIQNVDTSNGTFSGANPIVFTPTGDDAVVSTQDIEAQLNAGTNVTITTGNTGNQEGNITVVDSITKTAGGEATLMLEAANTITLNSGVEIRTESEALNLFLIADSDRSGAGDVVMTNAGLNANGGQISISGNSFLADNSGLGSSRDDDANGGSITITANSISLLGGGMGASANGNGNGGQINLTANTISFENSGLGVGTAGSGNAGQVTVTAGSLTLKNTAFDTTAYGGGNAGQTMIKANSVSLTDDSIFVSDASGPGNGGQVSITADSVSFTNGGGINTQTDGSGNTGAITINADTVFFGKNSGINSDPAGTGNGGPITINAGSLSLQDTGFGTSTPGDGNGGQININAGRLSLENSGIGSATGGSGNAGQINVTAGSISLKNSAFDSSAYGDGNGGQVNIKADTISLTEASAFTSGVYGAGNGGQVNITANTFSVADDGGIGTQTEGSGRGGQVNVTAHSIVLRGGGFSSETSSTGNGGQINITADFLSIEGSRFSISTETSDSGQGGNITLHVGELVVQDGAEIAVKSSGTGDAGTLTLVGDSLRLDNGASLNASTVSGQGGNINLTEQNVQLNRGSSITVSSTGQGRAGNLAIQADSIRLDNQSSLNANTTSSAPGEQANITLRSTDLILRHGSSITTNASGTNVIGGNINIKTGALVALENSDIAADSADFRGGNVNVTAQGIFGTAFRPTRTPESDITATGANSSLSGTVVINRFGVDPNQGLTNLPTEVVDASRQIAQNCSTAGGKTQQNQFIVTGRGGLPDNPGETLSPDAVWTDLRHSSVVSSTRQDEGTENSATNLTASSSQPPIVEASGWEINNKGEVVLTANNAASIKPQHPWSNPATCPTR
jgi:filamentous hemagglutinin family protein